MLWNSRNNILFFFLVLEMEQVIQCHIRLSLQYMPLYYLIKLLKQLFEKINYTCKIWNKNDTINFPIIGQVIKCFWNVKGALVDLLVIKVVGVKVMFF